MEISEFLVTWLSLILPQIFPNILRFLYIPSIRRREIIVIQNFEFIMLALPMSHVHNKEIRFDTFNQFPLIQKFGLKSLIFQFFHKQLLRRSSLTNQLIPNQRLTFIRDHINLWSHLIILGIIRTYNHRDLFSNIHSHWMGDFEILLIFRCLDDLLGSHKLILTERGKQPSDSFKSQSGHDLIHIGLERIIQSKDIFDVAFLHRFIESF